jgi:hypothetical protein
VAADSPAAPAVATDPTGNWKWSITPPNSGQSFESTAKLDFKEGKLTGTVTGRMGETPISDATFAPDGAIAFSVARERDGQKFVMKYAGKLAGDAIKGTIDVSRLRRRRPHEDGLERHPREVGQGAGRRFLGHGRPVAADVRRLGSRRRQASLVTQPERSRVWLTADDRLLKAIRPRSVVGPGSAGDRRSLARMV